MILDEVLEEEVIYTEDSMVDMFVEGFLYALSMHEEGKKAQSIEELSETLSEAADIAINEISANYITDKAKAAINKAAWHVKHGNNNDRAIKNNNIKDKDKEILLKSKRDMHYSTSKKLLNHANIIMDRLYTKTIAGTYFPVKKK